jgi:hypothetical protein
MASSPDPELHALHSQGYALWLHVEEVFIVVVKVEKDKKGVNM